MRQYTVEDIAQIRIVYNLLKVRGMKIAAARQAIAGNRQGAADLSELLDRLQAVRSELVSIRQELGEL